MTFSKVPNVVGSTGLLLLVAYIVALGGAFALSLGGGDNVAAGQGRGPSVAYEVTTAQGETHVLEVRSSDPGLVLIEAQDRYGDGAKVRRMAPEESPAVDTDASSVAGVALKLPPWAALLCLLPVPLLLVAGHLRRREVEYQAVLSALSQTLSGELKQLQRSTGLDLARIAAQVERINRRGAMQLRWSADRSQLFDERLSVHSLHLTFCPHCNGPISARLRADLSQIPSCPHCMTQFDRKPLESMQAEVAARIARDAPVQPSAQSDFGTGLFIALALVFPPAAAFYAWRSAT